MDGGPSWRTRLEGTFSVILGSVTPFNGIDFNQQLYIGITKGSDSEFSPRTVLTSAPSSLAPWFTSGNNINYANGNVGIGTSGPHAKLTVWTPNLAGTQTGIRINNPVGFAGSGNGSSLVFSQDRDTTENYVDASIAGAQEYANTPDFTYLSFATKVSGAVAEKMRITSGGNLGIGTTNPTEKLTVAGSMQIGTGDGDYQYCKIGGGNSAGFIYGSYPKYGDGIHIGYNYRANKFGGDQVENHGGATSRISMGYGYIGMYTGTAVNAPPDNLALYVDGSARVGIGTQTLGYKLVVNGNAANSTGVWATLSDRRLKRDIEPIQNALQTVEQLQGVTFRWKDSARNAEYGRVRGMIAQEVEKVIPEWVKVDPNGYKRIEPVGIDAILIEAIKAQQKLIEELQTKVSRLETKLP